MENSIKGECPVCKQRAIYKNRTGNWVTIECLNCGPFKLGFLVENEIESRLGNDLTLRAIVSHNIRKQQSNRIIPKLTTHTLSDYLRGQLPTIQEQADNLLTALAQLAGEIGVEIKIVLVRKWIAVCGAKSEHGVLALIDFLKSKNFLKSEPSSLESILLSITLPGWIHYEQLQKQAKDSTIAFMAMKFGDTELDEVVNNCFRPAVAQTGFRLQKLTDEQRAGLIDDQLRVQIRRSRILIADLTHGNNGAYWEAGFAEGLGIPVIYTCKKSIFDDPDKKPHFDTNHYLTVPWDPEDLTTAAEKLKATIRATLPEVAKLEDD